MPSASATKTAFPRSWTTPSFGVERTLYETDIDGVVNRYSRPGGGAAPGLELGALSAEIYTLPIPEPGSLAVFGLGLAVLGLLRRRRAA